MTVNSPATKTVPNAEADTGRKSDDCDPRFMHCPHVDARLDVRGNAAECRRQHGCTIALCPLGEDFGFPALERRLMAFASAFDLWPVGLVEEVKASSGPTT